MPKIGKASGTDFIVDTPAQLKGKELEALCLVDAKWREARGDYTMGRYGVQVAFRKVNGKLENTVLSSLPDFEGLLPSGQQFIFDCKVCSSASFGLYSMVAFRERQLSHLMKRAEFGGITFLLLHFNQRSLKARVEPATTYAFPTWSGHTFWEQFNAGELRSISRLHCDEYGVVVKWRKPSGCRKERPDLLTAILELSERSA